MEQKVYFVYALVSSKDNRIYVGFTKNIESRIKEHNLGKTKSTKFYRPWKLFYSESIEGHALARKREKELKSGFGKEFLRGRLSRPCSS